MAIGDSVVSVSGGSADQDAYPLYDTPSLTAQTTSNGLLNEFSEYKKVRDYRVTSNDPSALIDTLLAHDSLDWLVLFEALELAIQHQLNHSVHSALINRLQSETGDEAILIHQGLTRLGV